MKLWSIEDVNQVKGIPVGLKQRMEEVISILDESYGSNRKVIHVGGYILFITDDSITELEQFFEQYPLALPEYVELVVGTDGGFLESLIMLGADFSVVLYIERKNIKLFPVLWEEFQEQI